MRRRAFFTSVILSIALVLFSRFGISAYASLFVLKFDREISIWMAGAAMFAVVKAIECSPFCSRLGLIIGIKREWCMFAALAVAPIDLIILTRSLPVFERGQLDPANILILGGSIGWAWLAEAIALQWYRAPSVFPAAELPALSAAVIDDRIELPLTLPVPLPPPPKPIPPIDSPTLDTLTQNPASTILIGQPGTGKSMTGSSMARRWAQQGHHLYYIDSKMDEKELSLWDDACEERYQFDGTLIRDNSEWCGRMLEAFEEFENFRLSHLSDGKHTICILDELPALMSAFKNYKPDPTAALNFINRIVNQLPSRNCHILLLAQNPSCSDTLPTGTIGTLNKIILAKVGGETQLTTWANLTLMKGIPIGGVSVALRKSPVGRACYYSAVNQWLAMDSLIREGDYSRDKLK